MHADGLDRLLMTVGSLGAIVDGLSYPIILVITSKILNTVGFGLSAPNFLKNINQNIVYYLDVIAVTFVGSFLEGYCWTQTGERQASRIRVRYLRAVLRQEVGYFDLNMASTTDAITSVSSDSFVIQDALSEKLPNFLMNCSTFVGGYVISLALMWPLPLAASPTVALLVIPGLIYARVLLGLSRRIQAEYSNAGLVAEQAVSSIRSVYAFSAERCSMEAFSAALDSSVGLGIRQGLAKGVAIGSNGIIYSIWAFVTWFTSQLVMQHSLNGGTAFVAGSIILFGGIALGTSLTNVRYFGEAISAAERIREVIQRKPAIDSESGEGDVLETVAGRVEFREVRFAYPARPEIEVFKKFNLKVPAGRTVALVGMSGSGKSTAVALLQRFYDPATGEITLDGVDIRKLRLKWLRAQMGLVGQEPALFATTIKENILFGKADATMEEVVAATVAANAYGFISQLPQGFDTQVGESGIQMSGGQKQRIAIARAVVRSPKIMLLDEATSALDSESERIVQEALDVVAVGRTTIVIAHRLSTIRNADIIAFVHDGQVIESGSHDDLVKDVNSHYAALIDLEESAKSPDVTCTQGDVKAQDKQSFSVTNISESISKKQIANVNGAESHVDDIGEAKKLPAPSYWRLLMMNAPEWRQGLLGSAGALLLGTIEPTFCYNMGSMISVYFSSDHQEIKKKAMVYSLIFVSCSIGAFTFNVIQHYNFAVMGEKLTKRVRERMLSTILTFEVGWFNRDENSTGSICSRLAKDASVVRSLVGDRMALAMQALSAVAFSYMLGLVVSWRLATVMIAVQPIVIMGFYFRREMLKKISSKGIKAQSESSKVAAEAVANFRTVTAFSSQDHILRLFQLTQLERRREGVRNSWIAGVGLGFSQAVTAGYSPLSFGYGGHLFFKGHITSKALFQTVMILLGTARVIAYAGAMTTDLTRGSDTVASVFSILDRTTQIEQDDYDGHRPESLVGAVEFNNVDFTYPARPFVPILRNFSLSMEAGKSIALVGSSGSGKSTIISLVERFYDPLQGVVCIDGRDIRSYNLRSLRKHIALVGQEATLFSGTVLDNITYGMEGAVSDGQVEAAARVANAHDFICGLNEGYRTFCGDRGEQFSGGQKQRIAIARAMLRNPAILLLDEATSALDVRSEKAVKEALERVMVGKTSVVVAHRLSTVRNCDAIAVVEKGVLVEKGTHATLMAKGSSGNYYHLVNAQKVSCDIGHINK
ncbi:hypothetical protein HPP92_022011 [Vanilla planifolia]|uniref:Uncharacterized protein n=1 Tax=Vanilla planifolia TaxID=51239 RepID=A0A835Q2A5_VANPL|nr:hypothetical protein HPP92_022011 [Vanilla planifolia]